MNNFNSDKRLGVLIAGLNGAVSTTFIAGTLLIRKGLAKPVGSLSQLGFLRIKNKDKVSTLKISNILSLTNLDDLVFGGWDIRNESCFESANYAKVLAEKDIESVKEELSNLRPMPAVFDQEYVRRLKGSWIKKGFSKFDLMEQIREDIRDFKNANNLERVVVIWCASTEIFKNESHVHNNLDCFREGMKRNDPDISPSMLYAYASIAEGAAFINGAPNLTTDIQALIQFAEEQKVPVSGKDFKTGQTLIKTVIAPMIKARMLGLNGWFSSNILGNRDGEVLDDPDNFKTKELSKLSVLDGILQPDANPELYKNFYHTVKITYYPPSGDNKEGWDNIDIFGWLGYPMQIKINFLCRDSILAAPLVLDLILFTDLAHRNGMFGIQEWLSFYFKSPIHNVLPEHDLFIQLKKLKAQLRKIYKKERQTFTPSNGKNTITSELIRT